MAQVSSEECHGLECDVCLAQGLNKEATTYCKICDELLCQACENAHRGMKLTRNHGIVAPTKITKSFRSKSLPISFCDFHNTEKVEFFCKDHSDVFCKSCKFTTHRTCKVISLMEKAKDVTKENQFEKVMQTIMTLNSKFEKLNTSRKDQAKTTKMLGKQFLEELKVIKEKVFDYIRELEEKLAKEINEAVTNTTADTQSHITTADFALQDISSSLEMLRSCSEVGDEEVMAIGCLKVARKIEGFESTVESVEKEISSPNLQLHLIDIENLKSQINSLGSITCGSGENFLDLKVTKCFDLNIDSSSCITGSAFMQSGELVLCDHTNHSILLYTQDFKQKFSLKCSSRIWDVAVLCETEVVVTQPDERKLLICSVKENILIQKEIDVAETCYGIAIKDSTMYVSTFSGNNGKILVLDKAGQIQRTIEHNILSQYSIHTPHYICVSANEDRIYFSCYNSHKVSCVDKSGRLLFQWKGDIKGALGMYVDDEDNVLVCGSHSNKVCLVKADGTLHKDLLTNTDGITQPFCLAYRASDGALIVGMQSNRPICKVFMLSK